MEIRNNLAGSPASDIASPVVKSDRPRGLNLRWVIVAIITLLTLTNYLDRGNLSVAAPLIMRDLHISNTMMGVILSAFVWPYALTSLPTGWAVDRFGAKVLMAFAAGTWSIVGVFTGLARSVQTFVWCRIALGVAESPLFPSGIKATDAWFPDHEKAIASSIYLSASQFGLAIAPPVSTFLMVAYGWPAMFMLMGAFGFVSLLGWLILYREPQCHPWLNPRELAYIRSGQMHARAEAVSADQGAHAANWFTLLTYRTTWVMVIGGFCLQYVLWFYIAWLPTYLQRAQGITISRTGLVAAIPYIAGGIGVVIGGKLSDSLVRRGLHPLMSRRILLSVSAILTGLAMFGTAFCSSPTTAVAMLTAGMFAYSLSSANYWTLGAEAVTTRRMVASLAGIQNFGGFLGGGCAPILTGIAVDRMGGFVGALVLTGCLALFSAVMYGLALKKQIPV
ncbi:MFS transporter [Burkholderia multivorans]|uniref:MFS transporter n=1 Tax=Burkholderia multivorans TaxID=87883 RepID=UPI0020187802|nr:MFS transporter [Burkholderia multivorans]MCL4661351.1 MFS transporter [Burkholderia multivorans]MCO1352781.1 MFS transporter [Burkholderia multivorans]MCO1413372.1 MFS transporter [Burkholderia multivorans]MCO1446437.1 MFS transporter [Burkholderia multivorans]UQP46850.1 MFS transporter [Burkholderia multivorans]